jgi:hypothetical protein
MATSSTLLMVPALLSSASIKQIGVAAPPCIKTLLPLATNCTACAAVMYATYFTNCFVVKNMENLPGIDDVKLAP